MMFFQCLFENRRVERYPLPFCIACNFNVSICVQQKELIECRRIFLCVQIVEFLKDAIADFMELIALVDLREAQALLKF